MTVSVFIAGTKVTALTIGTQNTLAAEAWFVSILNLFVAYIRSNTFLTDTTRNVSGRRSIDPLVTTFNTDMSHHMTLPVSCE